MGLGTGDPREGAGLASEWDKRGLDCDYECRKGSLLEVDAGKMSRM